MVDSYQETTLHGRADYVPYDKRKLSYANTFPNPWQANTIRAIEWVTGKPRLLGMIRDFERSGVPEGQAFWGKALRAMRIDILTPDEQILRIPRDGPVIVVANHPHGLVDGVVIAEMIGRVRQDYKILTRSLLTGVKEISQFMIPVPFAHEVDAFEKNVEMRKRAMDHLATGGVVAFFPSGLVASSETMFGPVVEAEWGVFTAKMIRKSGATVLPVYFPGANSRWYQIANQISATIRQGLLLYEVIHAMKKPQKPVIGQPIPPDAWEDRAQNPRAFMAWLRETTLALRDAA
ncbi:MAG: lysophospholipid acyltransferase family protein [Rhodobacter sp.]|nr:lysophospholipid acyltransferase family protein [Rhodobacter sp.]